MVAHLIPQASPVSASGSRLDNPQAQVFAVLHGQQQLSTILVCQSGMRRLQHLAAAHVATTASQVVIASVRNHLLLHASLHWHIELALHGLYLAYHCLWRPH